jgi:hypothetical protein
VDTAGSVVAPRAPRHRVDPRALRWWTVRSLLGVATVLLPQAVALLILGDAWLVASTSATAVIGAAYVVVMPRWRYRVHRWEADEHAVYALAGWLSMEWRVAPISRIQTIDTQRTALQRLFRLATVTVTTASAAGPVRIEGLDAGTAAQLAHRLTEITAADSGDAT